MTYSCAYWRPPRRRRLHPRRRPARQAGTDLPQARSQGRHAPARRRLRLGCARRPRRRAPRVQAVGITLSQEQAEYARKRIFQAGLSDRVEIRVQDGVTSPTTRSTRWPASGWPSISASSGGRVRPHAARPSRPGGRLLNHQIVRRPGPGRGGRTFIDAYVSLTGSCCRSGTSSTRSRRRSRGARRRACASTTPARCAAGSPTSRASGTARSSWPAQAGLGSGAST